MAKKATRVLGVGLVAAASIVLVGFVWFVAISWGVLRAALGTGQLVALLIVAAAAAGAWGAVLVRQVRPRADAGPLRQRARAGLAAVSVLAAVCGVAAVPATRARLETNKCRKVPAADAGSQARCHVWLEGRRQWWTVGLSHQNGGGARP